ARDPEEARRQTDQLFRQAGAVLRAELRALAEHSSLRAIRVAVARSLVRRKGDDPATGAVRHASGAPELVLTERRLGELWPRVPGGLQLPPRKSYSIPARLLHAEGPDGGPVPYPLAGVNMDGGEVDAAEVVYADAVILVRRRNG